METKMQATMEKMVTKKHEKQLAFLADKSRNKWIFGGNRTGKTTAGAMEAVNRATQGKTEGWVVSLSKQVQRDVAQRKILEILDEREISYDCVMSSGRSDAPYRGAIDFIEIAGGSRIGFKNCEQGREKFQGTGLDWVWFDEEPPVDVYDECLIRTMDRRGSVFGTMTPLKGRTWVYDRIYMRVGAGISVHEWSWADNPFLSAEEVAIMEGNYSTEILESRKYGRFLDGLGMVYKEFSDENIVENGMALSDLKNPGYNASRFVYTGISIDPGYTNPTAVLWLGVDYDNNIFVIDEYKESGRTVEQIAKVIFAKSNELGVPVENVFIDSAATAQTLGEPRSVAEQFREHGIMVNTGVEKNVLDGIFRLKSLFRADDGTRKLFVFGNCVSLVKEIRGYFWGDRNKPVKSNDHCLDALRYFVMSHHDNYRGSVATKRVIEKPKINKIENFKRRIIYENG